VKYDGGCHCGAIRVNLTLSMPPGEIEVRACDCTFCRAHGARNVTDASGLIEISYRDPNVVERYRFGLRTADFIICRACGVYVAAVALTADGLRATMNVNVLTDRDLFRVETAVVSYSGETAESRLARRAENWTPATLRDAGSAG
jgi:hypothetical protein